LPKSARSLEQVPVGARLVWAAALLAVLAIGYAITGIAGLAPLPRSVRALANEGGHARGYALVSGYYMGLPFTANGNGIPPYVFSGHVGIDTAHLPPNLVVHVAPTLADLRAYRVVAVIDTATGDGSQWSPYVIHTVASVSAFVGATIVAGLVLIALLFWIAGYIALAVQSRAPAKEARRAAG
jgi:hypothetical protein